MHGNVGRMLFSGRIRPQTSRTFIPGSIPPLVLSQPFISSICKTPKSSFYRLASSLSFVLRHTAPIQEAGLLATQRYAIYIY